MNLASTSPSDRVLLVPTEGCYQTNRDARLIGETKTEYRVCVSGETRIRRFRKDTLLHVSPYDRQFPNYRLSFPHERAFPVRIVPTPEGENPVICTFADLLRDNPDMFTPHEAYAAAEQLRRGEPVKVGGGAAAAFTLERCSPDEWQAVQAAQSGSNAQPSSRSR
jgi:hypothetical protein